LSANQIRDARSAVERHLQEITDAWHRHFGR
jgi:ribosomal protein L16/L10AE